MNLSDYLNEMEYAVRCVVDALWHENSVAKVLRTEIEMLQRVAAENYERAHFIQQNSEDADDLMLGHCFNTRSKACLRLSGRLRIGRRVV